jgi:ATP-dependent DNA helicase RecG
LISYEQLLHGNISECRNKTLQTLFTMIGAAEKAGSGIDKIRMGWNSQHWRSPVVREQMRPDRVLWILPMLSLIPEESLDRLKQRFGKRFATFNKLEIQALITADLEGYVDNARMRQITNHHAADITSTLQSLVSQGSLTQEGQGRWTRYSLPTQPDSVHSGIDSVHKVDDSVHKEISYSVHKGEIPEDQWVILLDLSKSARENQRLPPGEMEKIILILCKDRWLTRNQLSNLVNRNPDGLRTRFLTQMVRHELLKLRYPDKPNRVDQAYTTN